MGTPIHLKPAATILDGTELVGGDQASSDVKITTQQIANMGGLVGYANVSSDVDGSYGIQSFSILTGGSEPPFSPVPFASVLMPVSVAKHAPGGNPLLSPSFSVPGFVVPAIGLLHASIFLTDLTGANTLTLDNALIATLSVGPLAATTYAVDFDVHSPTIVGTDLSAASNAVTTAAGGMFAGVISWNLSG